MVRPGLEPIGVRKHKTKGWDVGDRPTVPMPYFRLPKHEVRPRPTRPDRARPCATRLCGHVWQFVHAHTRKEDGQYSSRDPHQEHIATHATTSLPGRAVRPR